jgi:hypothetical protein
MEILLDDEYGPAFIKRNLNSKLYQASLLRSCATSIKVNTWVRNYGVDLQVVHKPTSTNTPTPR